jgi:hypothetical protein
MAELGSFLDTGDKVASIVGAVAGLAALWIAVHAGVRLRRARMVGSLRCWPRNLPTRGGTGTGSSASMCPR